METWEIREGDALKVLESLEPTSVDAIVTDPPYGLGFMGKAWDAVPPGDMVAKALLRVAKPGAHLVAFGGTRTHHRLMCAFEDAGWEIRDTLAWVYGSGFPKSHNLDGEWDGWGTALKPAHEPIVLARKPLGGAVAANVAEHGTGALNVDGCRVPVAGGSPAAKRRATSTAPVAPGSYEKEAAGSYTNRASPERYREPRAGEQVGRWPPNLLLGHGACCGDKCGPCCPVREMDEQSGELPAGTAGRRSDGVGMFKTPGHEPWGSFTDSGGASRFFPRFRYVAKASSGERNAGLEGMDRRRAGSLNMRTDAHAHKHGQQTNPAVNHHPTVKPVSLMRWLCRLVTPPGGLVLDPFLGSGTTMIAALQEGFRCIGIEREPEYVELARRRVEENAPLFNRAREG